MTLIGVPGVPARLKATLSGPGSVQIPIAGFNIMNTVGAIPTCSIVIPIEFIGQMATRQKDSEDDNLYTLSVGYVGSNVLLPIFTGYFSGDGHEVTGSSCGAQASLIHPASKIDEGQIVAQGLHSSSSIDFSYIIRTKGSIAGASNNPHMIEFYKKDGNLIDGMKAGIASAMAATSGQTTDADGKTAAYYNAKAAIKAVNAILVQHGGVFSKDVGGSMTLAINEWIRQIVANSLTGRASMWDLLSSLFSSFGILLVCDCSSGKVHAFPDVSGMRPPGTNVITGKVEVTAIRASSSIVRNIGQVTLFSSAMQNDGTAKAGPQVAFVSYPPKKKEGSELGISVPGWLNPLAQPMAANVLKDIQVRLAKTYYYIERNKMKTAVVSTPLAPKLMPGTMVMVDPFSAMKPIPTAQVTALTRRYVGYLYQVSHIFDGPGKQIYSLANIRNYVPEKEVELIGTHPLFDDAKCPEIL